MLKEKQTGIFEKEYKLFGNKVLVTQSDFASLKSVFEIDFNLHRNIDSERILIIRDWILTSVEQGQPLQIPPFLFSARGNCRVENEKWELKPDRKLFILDGEHTILAIAAAIQYFDRRKLQAEKKFKWREAKKVEHMAQALKTVPIGIQIYLDLSDEEEKKLMVDIKTDRRQLQSGVVMLNDQRNEYIILTRKMAKTLGQHMEIESKRSRLTDDSSSLTTLSIMYKCSVAMWEGDLNATENVSRKLVKAPYVMEGPTIAFYQTWLQLFPSHAYNREKFVSGLAVIQIALAYTVYLLNKDYHLSHQDAINKLKLLKPVCTWEHNDDLFGHLYDHSTGRIKNISKKTTIKQTANQFIKRIVEKG
ncbi:hypothetical protein M3182_04500 [Mesobacillus maritimus]|uniref:DNA sulfur modification protein DndB n=1 Tax=Mesobacillus maritimus TaxID=1643336 RepID=UPI00203F0E52|nr:DNA sulfur modification protein DndB [Mesobacillus maritimus]MCM3585006.1 hypothetical protein [Mesobacillus maritimus]